MICRVFKKKNHHKTLDDNPIIASLTAETRNHMFSSACKEGALDQILEYMGRNCNNEANNSSRFLRPIETAAIISNGAYSDSTSMKLPSLESPNSTSNHCYQPMMRDNDGSITNQQESGKA